MEYPITTTLPPCTQCVRAEKKNLLPKEPGFSPIKEGIWWYLFRMEKQIVNKFGDYGDVKAYLLKDPYRYYNPY